MRLVKTPSRWKWHILFVIALFSTLLSGQTVSELSCVAHAIVSVDNSCSYVLDPHTVLLGDTIPEQTGVFVFDRDPSNRALVECPGTYNYAITNERNAIICWGLITLVDDSPPVVTDTITRFDTLECAQIDKILNNPNTIRAFINGQANPYYLGAVQFAENCQTCNCELTVKFFDQVDFYPCDSLPYFARITRRWTATDCQNRLTQVDQYFHLVRPSFDNLQGVPDLDIPTCTPDEVQITDQYPFWIDTFGDSLYLNEINCNLDVQVKEQWNNSCNGNYRELQRQITVFDWCTGNSSVVDEYRIRAGDLEAPAFSGNARPLPATSTLATLNEQYRSNSLIELSEAGYITKLVTDSIACSLAMPLHQGFLQEQFGYALEDCSESNYSFSFFTLPQAWQPASLWQYSAFNTPAAVSGIEVRNIPPGLHAMVITAIDDCGHSSKGLLLFEVQDKIPPEVNCPQAPVEVVFAPDAGYDYRIIGFAAIPLISTDNCQVQERLLRRAVPQPDSQLEDWIALGLDTDQNGTINELDYWDQNQNGQQDSNEYNWSEEDGLWFTPWSTSLISFCRDVNQAIQVQSRFSDTALNPLTGQETTNTSYCQFTIKLVDTSILSLAPLPDLQIDCQHPVFNLLSTAGDYFWPEDSSQINDWRKFLGQPVISGNSCGGYTLREVIAPSLDNCGFGVITRSIIVEKTGTQGLITSQVEQQIHVQERLSYWIKFPGDVHTTCHSEAATQDYLEFTEQHCDLLASTYTDEYLYAPQDAEACYKIFRTYRVINWCEYDGLSDPVIVGRDWDTWNGNDCGTDYLINPHRPDGNNLPGDRDLYVIVQRNFSDLFPDTVYYDADADPFNHYPDNPATQQQREGYWWKVISDALPCTTNGQLPAKVWGESTIDESDNSTNYQDRFGSFGYWQYTQHILVEDTAPPQIVVSGAPTICGNTNDACLVAVSLDIKAQDECPGSPPLAVTIWFDEQRRGNQLANYTTAWQDGQFRADFPTGNHRLVIWAADQCGHRAEHIFNFAVSDCTAPQPSCLDSLRVNLMEGGLARIDAADLIASTLFDCTGQGPAVDDSGRLQVTDFSINPSGDSADRAQSSLLLSCIQLRNAAFTVEVHAWDDNQQHGFCESLILLSDDLNGCPPDTGSIMGSLRTEDGRFIPHATIALEGALQLGVQTDSAGAFAFRQLPVDTAYTIRPELDTHHRNGVTTHDIVLIKRHLLGEKKLQSPYQLIAADVNQSGTISTLDLIELRKLILSIDIRFAQNSSWRFIPTAYQFPDPANPWASPFPETITVQSLSDSLGADFIGIKIGDVTGNVNPSNYPW